MGWIRLGWIVGAGMLLTGCAATKEPSGPRMFSYVYEGSTYAIISTDPLTGEGNVLLRRDRSRPFLRADDVDQDGTLDTLLAGDVSLAAADLIYRQGLVEAAARGKRQDRSAFYTYTLLLEDGTYTIQTFEGADGQPYNRFVLHTEAAARPGIVLDVEADGVLDRIQQGPVDLKASQQRYTAMLERGLREGRIVREKRRYRVAPPATAAEH